MDALPTHLATMDLIVIEKNKKTNSPPPPILYYYTLTEGLNQLLLNFYNTPPIHGIAPPCLSVRPKFILVSYPPIKPETLLVIIPLFH